MAHTLPHPRNHTTAGGSERGRNAHASAHRDRMGLISGCGLLSSLLPRARRKRRGKSGDGGAEPVLLVSGMAGSVLHSRSRRTGWEIRVWVRILVSNFEFKQHLWSLYNPETGLTEPLNPDTEIVVPEDDNGLYAIDILDPSFLLKCFDVSEVHYFHEMIDMLLECGYKKGSTLFGYGFDFRQSNRIRSAMEGLKAKLLEAYTASGNKKVNIISHSMGGLLVQCFLSMYHDVFAKYVSKWICIACPFQGAPGCVSDALLTGLQFVDGFASFLTVSRWNMHQLVVECPSVYEMLPNPQFNWKVQPLVQVWRKQSDNEEGVARLDSYDPIECIKLFEEALRNNELDYNGKTIALPFNNDILKWATETREVLNQAQLPESIDFYNIYGTSFDSPFNVRYGSETSPIDDLSEVCHTTPQYSYVDGDGTVPIESAKADGFPAKERVGVKASHRDLLKDPMVFELLKQWLGVGETLQRRSVASSKVMDLFSEASCHLECITEV